MSVVAGLDQPRKETLGEKLKEKVGVAHTADTTANVAHPGAATTGSGYDVDDDADVEHSHQDTTGAYDTTDPAPRKKGLMTKIKEKLRH